MHTLQRNLSVYLLSDRNSNKNWLIIHETSPEAIIWFREWLIRDVLDRESERPTEDIARDISNLSLDVRRLDEQEIIKIQTILSKPITMTAKEWVTIFKHMGGTNRMLCFSVTLPILPLPLDEATETTDTTVNA